MVSQKKTLKNNFAIVPSSTPMNIRVTTVTSTNALLLWDPPLLQHRNGILTGYTVRISKRQSMESQIVTTSSNYFNVSSLEPHTEYRFAVSASTSKGGGPFSNYSSFITRQDGMCCIINSIYDYCFVT